MLSKQPTFAEKDCEESSILLIEKHARARHSDVKSGKIEESSKPNQSSKALYDNFLRTAELNLALNHKSLALDAFRQVLKQGRTPEQKVFALNSIGNCEFQTLGISAAVEAYDEALKLLNGPEGQAIDKRWTIVLKVNKIAALLEENKISEAAKLLNESDIDSRNSLRRVFNKDHFITFGLSNHTFEPLRDDLETAEDLIKLRLSRQPMPSSRSELSMSDAEAIRGRAAFGLPVGGSNESFSWQTDPRLVIIHWTDPDVLESVVAELFDKGNYEDVCYMLRYNSRDMRVLYGPVSKQALLAKQAELLMVNWKAINHPQTIAEFKELRVKKAAPKLQNPAEIKAQLLPILSEISHVIVP